MSAEATVPITAIVTAYDRVDQVVATLRHIRQCRPPAAELLVHVDGNRQDCADAIRQSGLADRVMVNSAHVGPGGARNLLLEAAAHPIVASFDDDSWPLDADYFQRVIELFGRFPRAAIIGARIFHRGEAPAPPGPNVERRADFVGAGCAYRRDIFLTTRGYVPLVAAYGMEEVDLSLRLHAAGHEILIAEQLRVEHDTDLSHHARPDVTSASVANLALLMFLRYPGMLWPLGLVQIANRIGWLLTHGRRRGVGRGLLSIPSLISAHRSQREPLARQAVWSYLQLRRDWTPAE